MNKREIQAIGGLLVLLGICTAAAEVIIEGDSVTSTNEWQVYDYSLVNSSIGAGSYLLHVPCVPVPGEVYFQLLEDGTFITKCRRLGGATPLGRASGAELPIRRAGESE